MCPEETPDTIQLHGYDLLYLLGSCTSVREQTGTDDTDEIGLTWVLHYNYV